MQTLVINTSPVTLHVDIVTDGFKDSVNIQGRGRVHLPLGASVEGNYAAMHPELHIHLPKEDTSSIRAVTNQSSESTVTVLPKE